MARVLSTQSQQSNQLSWGVGGGVAALTARHMWLVRRDVRAMLTSALLPSSPYRHPLMSGTR